MRGHWSSRLRAVTHTACWIKQLSVLGLRPVIKKLFECYDIDTLNASELFFIEDFKRRGFDLTNHLRGGRDGVVRMDVRSKLKLSISLKAAYAKKTPEQKKELAKKYRDSSKKWWASLSEEGRARASKKMWAKRTTEERKAYAEMVSAASRRRWAEMSAEQRKQLCLRISEGRRKAKALRNKKGLGLI